MAVSAAEIAEKVIELGYDKCGIIPVEMMRGYEAKLEERMEHFPETRRKYEGFRKFAYPEKEFPWAKAIVIVSFWYGKYRIPAAVRGHIAKYYLTDGRRNPDSQGYKASAALEKYLRDSGLRVAFNRDFALTALRWAAMQAGIGIVRKNNFFYTEKGSYQYLEAFLIDEPAAAHSGEHASALRGVLRSVYTRLSYALARSTVYDEPEYLRFLPDDVGRLGYADRAAARRDRTVDIRLRRLSGCLPAQYECVEGYGEVSGAGGVGRTVYAGGNRSCRLRLAALCCATEAVVHPQGEGVAVQNERAQRHAEQRRSPIPAGHPEGVRG